VALALRMRAAGESAPTIAKALGVSRATLYRALKRESPSRRAVMTAGHTDS